MATDDRMAIEETKHPAYQIEHAGIDCQVRTAPTGEPYLRFEGQTLPSLPGVYFGMFVTPETTHEEAESLAAQITKHCPTMWAQFVLGEINMDGLPLYELDEATGLAKLD